MSVTLDSVSPTIDPYLLGSVILFTPPGSGTGPPTR